MISAGHAADIIVVNSRRRMLACLRAGDPAGATREMESHLYALNFMGRLATSERRASSGRSRRARVATGRSK